MQNYMITLPDGRVFFTEADSDFLAAAAVALTLELEELPPGSTIARVD